MCQQRGNALFRHSAMHYKGAYNISDTYACVCVCVYRIVTLNNLLTVISFRFGQNPVAHCWSEPTHHKRKFCTVCRKRLDETPAVHCLGKPTFYDCLPRPRSLFLSHVCTPRSVTKTWQSVHFKCISQRIPVTGDYRVSLLCTFRLAESLLSPGIVPDI